VYTQVNELFMDGQRNYRLLFGQPAYSRALQSEIGFLARAHYFAPGERFALDLWSRNAYGTIRWRTFICETVRPGERAERVPFVAPAASILLSTKGAAQSRLALAWLASLEAQGIDPHTYPAERFLAAHLRLQGLRADRATPAQLEPARWL
jgi:hypothetical protein